MTLEHDDPHGDPIMEILYHGRGGATHVTATFPLEKLVDLVTAQKQSWADQEERMGDLMGEALGGKPYLVAGDSAGTPCGEPSWPANAGASDNQTKESDHVSD